MNFIPVELDKNLETCLQFRRDAYRVSYGSDLGFDSEETAQYFQKLAQNQCASFLHVYRDEKIIGQLEYVSGIERPNGILGGYIYLIYLSPDFRYQGLGQQLHDYILTDLIGNSCTEAALRFIPGNTAAEKFYLKNGWVRFGEADERGQVMVQQWKAVMYSNAS